MIKQRGNTLIEALIYLALFSILMGGAVVVAYNLIESAGRNQTKLMVQEEGDFLTAKIEWALTGIRAINLPSSGSSGSILSTDKWDAAVGSAQITSAGGDMNLSRGGNPALEINNSNIEISNLVFFHDYGGGANPESVRASFRASAKTPNGMTVWQDFTTTKFLRR